MKSPLLSALIPLLLLPFAAPACGQAEASLEVTVIWKGDLPKPRLLKFPKGFLERESEDARVCDKCVQNGTLKDERLLIDPKTKGIQNVAASIWRSKAKVKAKALLEPSLDNKNGAFAPHVQFAKVGSKLKVTNSDPFTHNARITGRGGMAQWNALIPAGGEVTSSELKHPGVYAIHCDVHPWMKAYVIATRHGAVGISDTDGHLLIKGLTPGKKIRVDLWHEELGRARITVDLEAGKTSKSSLNQADFR